MSEDGAHAGDERGERIRVTGRVQGVGFRAGAQQLAREHGLRGWVANVGRDVVMHVCGPAQALEAFVRALRHGIGAPARVDRVQREPAALLPRGAGFRIAPTVTSPPAERAGEL
jgi:hydrogenase maturation protein HypF